MSLWTLLKRSLIHYRRTHLGIVLGVMVASMVIVGALVVGDSVRFSLHETALSRLGELQHAVIPHDRYFRAEFADDLESSLGVTVVPLLMLQGVAVNSDQSARANQVQILGVPPQFWSALGRSTIDHRPSTAEEYGHPAGCPYSRPWSVVVNEALASQLEVQTGGEVLLRIDKPNSMPREAPLATVDDTTMTARLTVGSVLSSEQLGNFSFQANQLPPYNAFVPLDWLQTEAELGQRANSFVIAGHDTQMVSIQQADQSVVRHWSYRDAELEIRTLSEVGEIELSSRRVFLDPSLTAQVADKMSGVLGVLTYFVNELQAGNRSTPYSMVTAVGPLSTTLRRAGGQEEKGKSERGSERVGKWGKGSPPHPASSTPVPSSDDGIVINQWLADDLQVGVGAPIQLRYYIVANARQLVEKQSSFYVERILPMEGPAVSADWMPDFPGLSDVENCRNWEPGIPIDLDRIRNKDEDYWNTYRGTPKAFVTLRAGQSAWQNRFGNLTAIRFPDQDWSEDSLAQWLHANLDPATFGLYFQPIRERVLTGTSQSLDFGQLFLGLSFFLVGSALLLTGLLFVFAMEQRMSEIGLFRAVGLPVGTIRKLLIWEGSILACLGAILGALLGLAYTRLILFTLGSVWSGAVAGSVIRFHAEWSTVIMGGIASVLLSLLVMSGTIFRYGRKSASQLMSGKPGSVDFGLRIDDCGFKDKRRDSSIAFNSKSQIPNPKSQISVSLVIGILSLVAAVVLVGLAGAGRDQHAAGIFFGAGALLLVSGLFLSHALLRSWERPAQRATLTVSSLGLRSAIRRRGRSLAVIALFACGCFLMIAVSANRHDPTRDSDQRDSGTGGFALFGESSLPVLHDLNTIEGQSAYALDGELPDGTVFVPFRVHEGDDASCLNLNRAQTPRLLALSPDLMAQRHAFTFVKTLGDANDANPWELLNQKLADGKIPVVGDQATVTWALGKSVGDTLSYQDELGRSFDVQIVGLLTNSIFQGSLLMAEGPFLERFPSQSGYRLFLIDALREQSANVSATLTRALRDVGFQATPTAQRLAMFSTVENTYLAIFQVLGGLGLLLGSLGLGIVVLRNILERRGELALLRAIGFSHGTLQRMLLYEHWGLLVLGTCCGVLAALVAVFPALRTPGAQVPWSGLFLMVMAIVASGLLWIWLATRLALHGPLLPALRNE